MVLFLNFAAAKCSGDTVTTAMYEVEFPSTAPIAGGRSFELRASPISPTEETFSASHAMLAFNRILNLCWGENAGNFSHEGCRAEITSKVIQIGPSRYGVNEALNYDVEDLLKALGGVEKAVVEVFAPPPKLGASSSPSSPAHAPTVLRV
ncbi:MAG: hypothetical protein MRY21_02300 [Simkaniaceae bacterium]|nr:hypothetical protein [Simkaniaceae bacterium]